MTCIDIRTRIEQYCWSHSFHSSKDTAMCFEHSCQSDAFVLQGDQDHHITLSGVKCYLANNTTALAVEAGTTR